MIGNGSGMAIMVLTFLYGLKENGEFGHIIPLFRQDALRTKKLPRFKQGSDKNLLLLDDGVAADEGQFLGLAGDGIVDAQNRIGQPYNAEDPEDDAENPADQSDTAQDFSQNPGNDTDDAQDDALVDMEYHILGIPAKEQGNEPQNDDVAQNAIQLVAFNIFRAALGRVIIGAVNQFPQIVFIHFQSLFSIIGMVRRTLIFLILSSDLKNCQVKYCALCLGAAHRASRTVGETSSPSTTQAQSRMESSVFINITSGRKISTKVGHTYRTETDRGLFPVF